MVMSSAGRCLVIILMMSEITIGVVISSLKGRDPLETVCVYNSFDCRNRSHQLPPSGYSSCCQECVCSENCVPGNCCPNSGMNRNIVAPCRAQTSLLGKHQYLWLSVRTLAYYTIDTCPDHSDELLKSACNDPTDVEDHNLVSDVKNNNIFKNKKCAFCNGVTAIQPWNQGYVLDDETNITEVSRLIRENKSQQLKQLAQIYSAPPEDFPSHLYMCNHYTINKCNVSGDWDAYNETIVLLCENSSLTSQYTQFFTGYKNVYCALCNFRSVWNLPPLCPSKEKLTLDKWHHYQLSVLFQSEWLSTDNRLTNSQNMRCGREEVLDPLTAVCTDLTCLVGTFAYFGQCQNNPFSTDGFSISLILELTMDNDVEKQLRNDGVMAQRLVDSIGMKKIGCGSCHWQLFSLDDNTGVRYFLNYLVHTKEECTEEKIVSKYKKLLIDNDDQIRFRVSGDTIGIGLKIIEREYFDQFGNLTKLDSKISSVCKVRFNLDNKFFCPSITFNITSLQHFSIPQMYQERLIGLSDIKQWPKGNKEIYSVCLEDYIYVVDEVRTSNVKNSETMVQMNVACSGVLVCLSLIAVARIVQHPDIPAIMKVVVTAICITIILGRVLDALLDDIWYFERLTSLILRQCVGLFCSLSVSLIQLGILKATTEIGCNQEHLLALRSRVRFILVISFSLAIILASCEGAYLSSPEYTTLNMVESNSRNYIIAHSVTCFLPLTISLGIAICLVYKQVSATADASEAMTNTIILTKGMFMVSTFSFIFEIIRTAKEFSPSPGFPLILYISTIAYGILIFACFTFGLKHIITNCVVRISVSCIHRPGAKE